MRGAESLSCFVGVANRHDRLSGHQESVYFGLSFIDLFSVLHTRDILSIFLCISVQACLPRKYRAMPGGPDAITRAEVR